MKSLFLRSRPAVHALALTAYGCLSILITWPLARYWKTHVVGGPNILYDDIAINVWNIWWAQWALDHAVNPFWTSMLYYPEGVQLYIQTLNLASSLLVLPVSYLAGPLAAYNIALLLTLALTGYAAFLLVREFVPDRLIAFVCGALFVASPYLTLRFDNGNLNLISIQWLILYLVALIRLERTGSWKAIAATVITFVLVVLTDWYLAFVGGVGTAVWVIAQLVRADNRMVLLRRYLIVGGLLLLCLLPIFIGIAATREQLPGWNERSDPNWQGYIRGFSADALGLFFPAIHQPLWDEQATALLRTTKPGYGLQGWYVAAGHVLLLCGAIGVWRIWRQYRHLLLVAVVLWLLSLGPILQIAGVDTGIPLPYSIFDQLPLVSTGRRPSHFAVMTIILATVFAGLGLYHLTQRLSRRGYASVLLGVALLATFELWHAPWQPHVFEQHPVVGQVRAKPGAVVDLPYEWMESGRSLRYQIVHEQPVLGGYIARRPPYPSLESPLISQLAHMERAEEPDIIPVDAEALRNMQCYYRLRHVLLREDLMTEVQIDNVTAVLNDLTSQELKPLYNDSVMRWYELPVPNEECQPFLYLGEGWHDLEHDGENYWRWSGRENQINIVNPFDQPIQVTINIGATVPDASRIVELWNGNEMINRWDVDHTVRDYLLLVTLPPGTHSLRLRGETGMDQASQREVGVLVTELAITEWSMVESDAETHRAGSLRNTGTAGR